MPCCLSRPPSSLKSSLFANVWELARARLNDWRGQPCSPVRSLFRDSFPLRIPVMKTVPGHRYKLSTIVFPSTAETARSGDYCHETCPQPAPPPHRSNQPGNRGMSTPLLSEPKSEYRLPPSPPPHLHPCGLRTSPQTRYSVPGCRVRTASSSRCLSRCELQDAANDWQNDPSTCPLGSPMQLSSVHVHVSWPLPWPRSPAADAYPMPRYVLVCVDRNACLRGRYGAKMRQRPVRAHGRRWDATTVNNRSLVTYHQGSGDITCLHVSFPPVNVQIFAVSNAIG